MVFKVRRVIAARNVRRTTVQGKEDTRGYPESWARRARGVYPGCKVLLDSQGKKEFRDWLVFLELPLVLTPCCHPFIYGIYISLKLVGVFLFSENGKSIC